MLSELVSRNRVVGIKQSTRAVREGRACKVFFACDADPEILRTLESLCFSQGIDVEKNVTMAQLGEVCGISVGASVAAALHE